MRTLSDLQGALRHNRTTQLIALSAFILGILAAIGSLVLFQSQNTPSLVKGLRQSDISTNKSSAYTFIDPLIATTGTNHPEIYTAMRQEVSTYVAGRENLELISASVEFRDINESSGFSLNPGEQYAAGSLYKLPVMMAYYKIAETNSMILSQDVLYTGTEDRNRIEEIKSSVQLIPGKSYTVEQLIEHMILYSDNNAGHLLEQTLEETNHYADYLAVFSALGIDSTNLKNYTDNLTASKYSLFLRALYNATYLEPEGSERALSLLSKADFSEGIESGVPNYVNVAQKFGEIRLVKSDGTLVGKQLHNCGIVYFPKHPYSLCVMTKASGDDIKTLESNISSISRIVYKHMQQLYPES